MPTPSSAHLVRRCVPLALAALLLTGACAAPGVDAPGVQQQGSHGAHGVLDADTGRDAAPATVPRTQVSPSDAVQLRSTLERLLGAHVLVANEFVRATLTDDAARATAAWDGVTRNQQQLQDAVTSLAGAETGESFASAWQQHMDVLRAYATALQGDDTAGASAAKAQFTQLEQGLAPALHTVVGGQISLAALTEAATMHGEHLLSQADAFHRGDYDTAYEVQRDAFAHMIRMADVLARGVAAAKGLPTAELDAPRLGLQSALSRLLAEHMGVMVQAMRAAHDRSPDFDAAGRAVNANSTDLGGAVSLLYGDAAGAEFLTIWADHVEALIRYAGTPEQEARDAARQNGVDYAPRLARFLAGATEQRLPTIDLAAALTQHDDHLRRQLDAWATEDLDEAQAQAEQGYVHMFELSQALATAIGDVVAAKLPQGGPATGGGGLADGH